MPNAAASHDVQPLEMISAMTGCAYELGLAASRIAQAAGEDAARFLAASAEFRHCFFAVRMGIRLKMAHGTVARAAPGAVRAEGSVERERAEWPERPDWGADPGERGRTEREREREGDREPVSLPQFLKTLGVTAANAEARRAELPAAIRDTTLPRLQGLLRQANAPAERVGASPGAAAAVLARPPAAPAGRPRLLSSIGTLGVLPKLGGASLRRDSG